MKPITPHLWFDKEAIEAAGFYTSVFSNSRIEYTTTIRGAPSGDCDIVSFELCGQPFMAISAGPYFKFNPSISFQVKCATMEELDSLWDKLSSGGMALMELGEYPFSKSFGWCNDKYGLSWQVMFVEDGPIEPVITAMLMFVGEKAGKAEEAIGFYTSVFPDGTSDILMRYGQGEEPDRQGTVKYACFSLLGTQFAAMDSAHEHGFDFDESISFMVNCGDQAEIDYYWTSLSAVPESEQCGWITDKYGVSWQIVPAAMGRMLQDDDEARLARVMQAVLRMKKLDIETLDRAYAEA